jgi:5-methylcytosine-specific restriction endonuclease McrA
VSDRRYSTAAWQKLRRAVLERDGHVCQIQGPRCRGYATSVHHIVPSSQEPKLFWEPSNLAAACGRCNYGDGARVAAQNTRTRIARLEEVIWKQDAEIARLTERLAGYENGEPERPPATPRIY